MKNRLTALLLSLALLLGLAACGPAEHVSTPAAAAGTLELPNFAPPDLDADLAASPLIVYVPLYDKYQQKEEQLGWDAVNALLLDLGFFLEFEMVPGDEKAYKNFLLQNIHANAAFQPPILDDQILELVRSGQLGNFYNTGMQYAPNYTASPGVVPYLEPGTLSLMPTLFRLHRPVFPAVIIREDIATEYGMEVRTATQYFELLAWLKERNPKDIPGITNVFGGTSSFFLYDAMMPELGYWSNSAWQHYAIEIGSNAVRPMHTLPESRHVLEEFARLQRDKLLYVIHLANPRHRTYDEFPTALVSFYDFIDARYFLDDRTGLSAFDASGYRIYAFYDDLLPWISWEEFGHSHASGGHVVAGAGADVREFLRLMEWLGTHKNYNLLFYGVEGADYEMRDGRMAFAEDASVDWEAVRSCLRNFTRSEFRAVPMTVPYNYEAEQENLSPGYTLRPIGTELSIEDSFYASLGEVGVSERRNSYNDAYADLYSLHVALYYELVPPSEGRATTIIDQFMRKQWEREALLEEYARVKQDSFLKEYTVDRRN